MTRLWLGLWWTLGLLVADPAPAQPSSQRGAYVAAMAGCVGCHTDAKDGSTPFAGGRALETPFGVFYGPNITSHKETGLGAWSEADFKRALRQGERPDGAHYFPAFPYASFTNMNDADIADLWAFMRSLPAANKPNKEHQLKFPFGWRFLVTFWNWMFFSASPQVPEIQGSPEVRRGAYIIRALAHCGECHTPRNFLGGTKRDQQFAGARLPEGWVPNLTPTRLKKWSDADLKTYLQTGVTPEGDMAAETMNEVITNTTSKLTPTDMAALVAYLRTLPALPEEKK